MFDEQHPDYWEWVRYFHENGLPQLPEEPPTPEEPGDTEAPNFSFNLCSYLEVGAHGEQVEAMQECLAFLGHYTGRIDGDFGPMTESAVKKFQEAQGLYVDGEFGPKSIEGLNTALAPLGGKYSCGEVSDIFIPPSVGDTSVTVTYLREGTVYETPIYTYQSPNPGPTLLMYGGIHGNELSGYHALTDIVNSPLSISKGRLVLIPAFNKIAVEQNRRTLSRSGSAYSGKDFNRMFPVGKNPSYLIAKEMWELVKSQPNLKVVVDFHDGFVNSLGNTLIHSRQSTIGNICDDIRDKLNKIRPSGAKGPKFRSFTEPIGGSLTRKVGRDLNIYGVEVELCGRSVGDPLSLRKKYANLIIKEFGKAFGMIISF